MKRRAPLSRRTRLAADPAKVRAWLEGSAQKAAAKSAQLRADGVERRTPLRRTGGRRRAALPAPVRAEAFARSDGLCVGCLHAGRRTRATDPHHLLPVRLFPEHELEAANVVALCRPCHERHESAFLRLPWAAVAEVPCRAFLRAAAAAHGASAAYIRRTYPDSPADLAEPGPEPTTERRRRRER